MDRRLTSLDSGEHMIEITLPWAFALAPLPLLAWWLLPAAQQGRGGALRIPFYEAVSGLAGTGGSGHSGRVGLGLKILAWALLVLAASGPRWVGEPQAIPSQGRDLMLAIDLSGSMAKQDFEWRGRAIDRYSVVNAVARDFVAKREGDRLGLILFGTRAYLQSPLTTDRETVIEMLADSELGLAGEETAIGDAIGLSVKHLRNRPAEERVLVLLSDGASNAGFADPLDAARLAADEGIRIYTIGVGGGAQQIRTPFGLQRFAGGNDLDERSLQQIAELTGGSYFRADDTRSLVAVYERIDALEPTQGESATLRPARSLFHWPLAGSVAIAAALALAHGAQVAGFRTARLSPAGRMS
jgi:Ca-activated chloride channel family protein